MAPFLLSPAAQQDRPGEWGWHVFPRWIVLWGLAAIPLYVAAYVLAMYGVIGTDSTAQMLLYTPLAVQEMVLAVWMIARGFRPAAVSTTSELADGTLRDTPLASL